MKGSFYPIRVVRLTWIGKVSIQHVVHYHTPEGKRYQFPLESHHFYFLSIDVVSLLVWYCEHMHFDPVIRAMTFINIQ